MRSRSNRAGATSLSALIALCLSLGIAGCGYRVVGRNSALPSTWHTVAIPIFVNHTPTYRIEQPVTNAAIHEFLTRTKYRIVRRAAGADAVLRGEITDIQAVPLLFDANSGHVNTMLVTVRLKVTLDDQQSQEVVYRNDNFVFRNEYQVSSDVNHFFQEEGPAMQRMSRDFASDLVSRLLEGF